MADLQTHGIGVGEMIRTYAALILASMVTVGCSATGAPSKYDLPLSGIAHVEAMGKKQKFVLCAICPRPTPKTLALPEEEKAQANEQVELPKFAYVPAPAAPEHLVAADKTKFVVPFKYNSSDLGPKGKQAVSKILTEFSRLNLSDYETVLVHGYTDDLGGNQYNKMLGFRRANTVIKEMRKAHIRVPLSAIADGECCFVSDNRDEARRMPNRRAEVILSLKHK